MALAVTEGRSAERRKERGSNWRQSDLPAGSSGPLMQVSDDGRNLRELASKGGSGPSGRSVPKARPSCLGT